jgi:hypothetical protein
MHRRMAEYEDDYKELKCGKPTCYAKNKSTSFTMPMSSLSLGAILFLKLLFCLMVLVILKDNRNRALLVNERGEEMRCASHLDVRE